MRGCEGESTSERVRGCESTSERVRDYKSTSEVVRGLGIVSTVCG